MDIECFGCINWVKFSEVIFEGLIVGATVVLAYVLGRWQSNRNWKREIELREEEQKEKEKNAINLRRIDAMTILIKQMQEFRSSFIISYDQNGELDESDLKGDYHVKGVQLTREIERVLPLFPVDQDNNTNQVLNKLITDIRELALDHLEAKKEGYEMPKYIEDTFMSLIETIRYLQSKIEELVKDFG